MIVIKIPIGFKNDLIYHGKILCELVSIAIASGIVTYLLYLEYN